MGVKNAYNRFREHVPHWNVQKVSFKKKLLRAVIHILGWIGLAVIYYIAFSIFFDTPYEYEMKRSTRKLSIQYKKLEKRYDTLEKVLLNVIKRDRQVFHTLFESEPYNFEEDFEKRRWEFNEKLLTKTNKELGKEFFDRISRLDRGLNQELKLVSEIDERVDSMRRDLNYIPAIQPVINNNLTLLTASYGMRIHPFYKNLASHQGVDYTLPEGSRVFATADGRVKDVIQRRTTSGMTITLEHGDDYETTYSHLSKINVKKGQSVRRGDIIAHSGNTGLSFAPHLHYEVKFRGMRVDPIHYFFMELNPNDYRKITKIAQSGMQSFD